MADSVDTLGVDMRTRMKKLGTKEQQEERSVGLDSRSSR